MVSGDLKFDGALGSGLTGSFENDKLAFSDLAVTPSLGWSDGKLHWLIAASIFAPTGYYEKASVEVADRQINAIGFGKNRWAIMPAAAFTYSTPRTDASSAPRPGSRSRPETTRPTIRRRRS